MGWKYIDEEDKEQSELKLDTGDIFSVSKPVGFDDSAYQAKKPTYRNDYADRIDSLLSSLENREAFRYDAESDPLYQQYRSQYQREGSRAVDDTLAAAASHAGGMNSYAVTAAQQAGDYYNAKLMDVLPELTQLAYQMYQADYDEDVSNLKLLQSQEAEDYDRYQDALGDWYAELEAAYQQYRDSVADSKWQQDFDYEKEQDALAYEKWLEQFNHDKEQDALAYEKWREQMEYEKQQDAIANAQRYPQYTEPEHEEPVYTRPEQADEPAAPEVSGDRYAGTDYYQDAIDAALRGDRVAAEAALAKRAEKMASPDYHGTGGGTSMEEAYSYIESLLASSEDADISEQDAADMLDKSAWKEKRATGTGVEASYATYEDYVSDYLRYLTEG